MDTNSETFTYEDLVQNIDIHADLFNLTEEEVDALKHEVLHTDLLSETESVFDKIQPSKENQINSETLRIPQESDLKTIAPNDQMISNTTHFCISHGYEAGSQGQIPPNDKKIWNIEQNITIETTKPEILQTLNNKVFSVDQESMQTSERLQRNSELEITSQNLDNRGAKHYSVPNEIKVDKTVYEDNRKRKASNFQQVMENNQSYSLSRGQIPEKIKKIFSPQYNSGIRNLYFVPETSASGIDMASNNRLNEIHHEFSNVGNPQSHNKEIQGFHNIDKIITMKTSQNIESNSSVPQGVEILYSGKDILAVPGASGFPENQEEQNVAGGKWHTSNPIEMQSPSFRNKRTFACRVCPKVLDEHYKLLKDLYYFCCVCSFKTYFRAFLQMHSDIHCAKKVCTICKREYTEEDSHERKRTCNVCKETFKCKTYLDHHSLNHDEHFQRNCWICGIKFDEHFNTYDGNLLYVCCACGFKTPARRDIEPHTNMHRPIIFCFTCKEVYPAKDKDFHNNECICMMCGKKFKCHTLLEKHFVVHKVYCLIDCIFCKGILDNHYKKDSLECCKCRKKLRTKYLLRDHLFLHAHLRLFQCDVCGIRVLTKGSLTKHSKVCILKSV